MAFLYSVDKSLFFFFNRTIANPFFDFIMPYITEEDYWRIPILLIWLSLIIFGGKKGRNVALLVVLILALSDQITNFVLKPLVGRTRPCFVLNNVRLLINQPHSFSFPSSHATNMAAMATLFSVKYRKYTWFFVSVASLVAFSRMYVGVHYPSDILSGVLVGILCAAVVLWLEQWIKNLWQKKMREKQ